MVGRPPSLPNSESGVLRAGGNQMNAFRVMGRRRMTGALAFALLAMPAAVEGAQSMADVDWGYATSSDQCTDQCACGEAACKECCPCGWGHCTSVWGDVLFLHPTGADVPHAQQQNGTGGAGTVPFGIVGEADPDYEPGVRVGGDIAVSPTNSLAASGSWFEADAGSSLTAPIGGAVASFVTVPAPGLLTSVTSSSEISFYTAEAEYRSRLLQGPRHWVNGGLGLRYAHLEQDFNQNSISLPLALDELAVNTDIEFDGGGPRLTLDGGRLLGNRGFSIYARSSVSPLTGKFHANYSFRNESTDTQLAAVNFEDHRIMTLFDYELGLAWTGPRKRWRFAAGYTQSYWFNAVTTADFIPAVQSGIYSDISDTIMFDGLTARVEHLW